MKSTPDKNNSEGIGGNIGKGNSGGIGGGVGKGKKSSEESNEPRHNSSEPNRYNGGSASGDSGSCFVATAAFGTPLAYEVLVLKNWRDQKLRYVTWGRKFISFYYEKGYKAARLLNQFPAFKAPARMAIRIAIKLLKDYC